MNADPFESFLMDMGYRVRDMGIYLFIIRFISNFLLVLQLVMDRAPKTRVLDILIQLWDERFVHSHIFFLPFLMIFQKLWNFIKDGKTNKEKCSIFLLDLSKIYFLGIFVKPTHLTNFEMIISRFFFQVGIARKMTMITIMTMMMILDVPMLTIQCNVRLVKEFIIKMFRSEHC